MSYWVLRNFVWKFPGDEAFDTDKVDPEEEVYLVVPEGGDGTKTRVAELYAYAFNLHVDPRFQHCDIDQMPHGFQRLTDRLKLASGGATSFSLYPTVARMFDLLEGEGTPIYLDPTANDLLAEARREYRSLGLADRAMVPTGARDWILATRAGTMRSTTLALALGGAGYQVDNHDGLLVLRGTETAPPLPHLLAEIAAGAPVQLFQGEVTQPREKFHPFLTEQLLQQDMLSSRLDLPGLPALCRDILGRAH